MHNPPHPGKVIKNILKARTLGMQITKFCDETDISLAELVAVIFEEARISKEMASKLAKYLNTSEEMWLNMQAMYDSHLE